MTHWINMERIGILGTFWAWTFNLFSLLIDETTLKEISLILAILVSIATLFWYAGNMIIKRKEILRALKEIFRKKK
jgi:uncharacterized membrane protein